MIILYRSPEMSASELASAKRYFPVTNSRILPHDKQIILARYSTYPYYRELERDLEIQGHTLVNSSSQNTFLTDVGNWVQVLNTHHRITPRLFDLSNLPEGTSFVLKGKWKSRKDKWSTYMFAKDRKEVIQVYCRLQEDTLIGCDEIYIREYVPLKTFIIGINGLPITEEYRFFVLNDKILCGGFYWNNYYEDLIQEVQQSLDPNKVPRELLHEVIGLINTNATFYTVDVGLREDGTWIVIELNDGQQSGLSNIDPDIFYRSIYDVTYE